MEFSSVFINFQYFWEQRCREFNRQKKCNHLKGNQWGGRRDYAVSFHTFIDGSQRIACLKGCGFEVFNKPEWSFKWGVGMKMVEQSTNTPSSSERANNRLFDLWRVTGPSVDIGDANPIKGREKATPHRFEDSNDSIVI